MDINAISGVIVDAALRIHKELGPGLLINFGGEFLKGNIERLVNGLPDSGTTTTPSNS